MLIIHRVTIHPSKQSSTSQGYSSQVLSSSNPALAKPPLLPTPRRLRLRSPGHRRGTLPPRPPRLPLHGRSLLHSPPLLHPHRSPHDLRPLPHARIVALRGEQVQRRLRSVVVGTCLRGDGGWGEGFGGREQRVDGGGVARVDVVAGACAGGVGDAEVEGVEGEEVGEVGVVCLGTWWRVVQSPRCRGCRGGCAR